MADLTARLLAFPPEKKVSAKEYDRQAHALAQLLDNVSAQEFAKASGKSDLLDLLNPAVNTISYIFALHAQVSLSGKDRARTEQCIDRSVIFFTSFDPIQARYCGHHWRALLEWAIDAYPRAGVQDFTPLITALLRLDPTAGTFTSSHLLLLRLCLDCGVPSQALPILDRNIYAFPQTTPKNLPEDLLCEAPAEDDLSNSFITAHSGFTITPLKPEYILEYYLLGAHVYLGLHSYARAHLFLETVLLHPSPTHACSTFQVEAYKKYVLLGLLANGKSYGLPRTHDVQAMRVIRASAKAYQALADNFDKRDWRKFEAEVDVGMQIWNDDGNLRFVKEVGDALLRYRIIDLQKTYAALPISRIASYLDLSADDTLQLLQDMIQRHHLHATITPSTSSDPAHAVLHFDPAAPTTSTTAPPADLEGQTKRIESLIAYIRDADRRLQLSKEYAEYTKRTKRGAAGPDGELAEQMDLTWDAPILGLGEEDGDGDEDIMGS
ncbi:CSN3 COP9 constitutive [Neohortaea acidophila]|uniref:COP9 signalosome complex subunit 3 n=1 Tax=Neohortaea acidophila TaxID=245834 RepID=A0A6A6Q4S4_9PEZI|nr:CSN3 COP9 constitutive [Neohortaea acidophila]KAF2487305.1 CSN3 COP9 constitutive [Neohortaea acidophila]